MESRGFTPNLAGAHFNFTRFLANGEPRAQCGQAAVNVPSTLHARFITHLAIRSRSRSLPCVGYAESQHEGSMRAEQNMQACRLLLGGSAP